jgi:hypothetical protein
MGIARRKLFVYVAIKFFPVLGLGMENALIDIGGLGIEC